ncbi:MAG: hypothetical protein RIG56_01445 [Thalassobaculum sp.]
MPLMVWATGMPVASAKAVTASAARLMWTPPPHSISGRCADFSMSTAVSSAVASGRTRSAGAARWIGSTTNSASSNG